ncbi:MAG: dipeptidase, partial [Cyanobacteria bacterium NC_groundwater_1444_Ag_S-0.65um_54_12]|nr:dipeptidase [Cyanobacteria bacterium NC_groundwater_1444_Ag_S-0.65um_54_12]
LPRIEQIGINLQFLSLWIPPDHMGDRALHRAMRLVSCFYAARRNNPGLRLVTSIADISTKLPGFCLALEGAEPLADDPELLDAFYALGVRMIALTWNGRNSFADGIMVGERPGAITHLGNKLLQQMQELGIVLDLAHLAEAGFWHALELTIGPVVVSHANARAICNHPRNLSDTQLRAIAERDGVVGVCFVPKFLSGSEATLDDVVLHILHMIEVAGTDHVGLGGDFDGVTSLPHGLGGVQDLPAITVRLLESGLTQETIAKILGGNWRRVLAAVWCQESLETARIEC